MMNDEVKKGRAEERKKQKRRKNKGQGSGVGGQDKRKIRKAKAAIRGDIRTKTITQAFFSSSFPERYFCNILPISD